MVGLAVSHSEGAMDALVPHYETHVDPLEIPIILGDHHVLSPADMVAMKRGSAVSLRRLWFAGVFQAAMACAGTQRAELVVLKAPGEPALGRIMDLFVFRSAPFYKRYSYRYIRAVAVVVPPDIGKESQWQEPTGTDDYLRVPHSVWLTCQASMQAAGLKTSKVYRLDSRGNISCYGIDRDEKGVVEACGVVDEFWRRFMDFGEIPMPLGRSKNDSIRGNPAMAIRMAKATKDQIALVGEHRHIVAQMKRLKVRLNVIARQLNEDMGDTNILVDPISGDPMVHIGAKREWVSPDQIMQEAVQYIPPGAMIEFRTRCLAITPVTMDILESDD